MAVLIVLLVIFLLTLIITRLRNKKYNVAFSGTVAMAGMMLFTAIGHFVYPEGMSMMLPEFVPFKKEVIYLTGIIELTAAIGLLIQKTRQLTAWLLIIFFIIILPANIYAAINHVDLQRATAEGPGPNYLWFRVPLQVIFILWTWKFCIKIKS